jgi:hypothetical protein
MHFDAITFQPFGLVGAKKIAVAGLQNPEGMPGF